MNLSPTNHARRRPKVWLGALGKWLTLRRWALVYVAMVCTLGCSGAHPSKTEQYGGCANSCETNDWGRLIVAMFPLVDAGAMEAVTIEVVGSDGVARPNEPNSCHDIPAPYSCTFEYSFGSTTSSVTITARVGGNVGSTEVALKPLNYCGREIAYATVTVDAAEAPLFGAVEYISPCNLIGL